MSCKALAFSLGKCQREVSPTPIPIPIYQEKAKPDITHHLSANYLHSFLHSFHEHPNHFLLLINALTQQSLFLCVSPHFIQQISLSSVIIFFSFQFPLSLSLSLVLYKVFLILNHGILICFCVLQTLNRFLLLLLSVLGLFLLFVKALLCSAIFGVLNVC